jgi:hypothetical protein
MEAAKTFETLLKSFVSRCNPEDGHLILFPASTWEKRDVFGFGRKWGSASLHSSVYTKLYIAEPSEEFQVCPCTRSRRSLEPGRRFPSPIGFVCCVRFIFETESSGVQATFICPCLRCSEWSLGFLLGFFISTFRPEGQLDGWMCWGDVKGHREFKPCSGSGRGHHRRHYKLALHCSTLREEFVTSYGCWSGIGPSLIKYSKLYLTCQNKNETCVTVLKMSACKAKQDQIKYRVPAAADVGEAGSVCRE